MADREFVLIGENTLEVAFVMEVNREMNEHNKLYGRFLPDQHNIGSITGLRGELDANSSAIVAEKERAESVEGSLDNLTTENKDNLVSAINEVDLHADNNATNLSNHINDKSNPHEVTKAQVGLGNCDNTADIDKPISTAIQTALDNITNGTTSIAYDNTTSGLSATTLQGAIDEIDSDLDNVEDLIPSTASSSNKLIDKEYVDTADNDLQSQIDTIEAKSDVTDIVGTYAELQAYDTSKLTDGDVIKVLKDETQNDAITYYRWIITGGVGTFDLIGSEGPYYTVAETDTLLDGKQDNLTPAQLNAVDSGITSAKVTQYDGYASGKANVGLDNLNANGQMIIDSQNGTISNCITEIPQNIIYSFENNVFTFYRGSKLIGTGTTYTEIPQNTTTSSTLQANGVNGEWFLTGSGAAGSVDVVMVYPTSACTSGHSSDRPTTGVGAGSTFYDVDNNMFSSYNPNTQSWDNFSRLPIGVIQRKNNTLIIKAIFNGAGYAGHHAFVYPNNNGLWANGIENGTLKSGNTEMNSLLIVEMTAGQAYTGYNKVISLMYTDDLPGAKYNWRAYKEVDDISEVSDLLFFRTYVKKNNIICCGNGAGSGYNINVQDTHGTPFIEYNYNGTTVTQFDIRQPYEGARDLLTDSLQADVTTLTGYDSTQTQTLKNINGVLQWVTD